MQRENIAIPGTREHKLFLQRLGFVKCGTGMVIYALAAFMQRRNSLEGHVILPFIAIAVAVMFLGAVDYARSKGLHPAFGILAVCTIIGLFFLVAWPDNYKFSEETIKQAKKKRK